MQLPDEIRHKLIADKKDTIFNDTTKNSIKSLEQEEKIFLTV